MITFLSHLTDGEQNWGGVEETAYGMLAKLTANPSNTGAVLPALRWLVKKFGKGYGFSSTQVSYRRYSCKPHT